MYYNSLFLSLIHFGNKNFTEIIVKASRWRQGRSVDLLVAYSATLTLLLCDNFRMSLRFKICH